MHGDRSAVRNVDRVAAARDLAERGYCVIDDVLGDGELAALRDRLDDVAHREREAGTAWFSNGNQRVFNLLNRGHEFVSLIEHPVALEMVGMLLPPEFLLSSITANIAMPDNVPQALHADQGYVRPPWPHPETVQVCWMLDDFTAENGGTRVVTGTHHRQAPPDDMDTPADAVSGRAGSVLCMDGRLWHGTGVNRTSGHRRRGIFAYYCSSYLRQQENVFRSLRLDVRNSLNPRQRQLLGYDIWEGLGVVDGIPREWMGTGQRSGATTVDGPDDHLG